MCIIQNFYIFALDGICESSMKKDAVRIIKILNINRL